MNRTETEVKKNVFQWELLFVSSFFWSGVLSKTVDPQVNILLSLTEHIHNLRSSSSTALLLRCRRPLLRQTETLKSLLSTSYF